MATMNVNVAVEVDDDTLEEMIYNPSAGFHLKMMQRDRIYDGTPEPPLAQFVWKVQKNEQ